MSRQNGEGDFLTKDGERRFAENLRKVLLSDNPNPRRKGRPDPKTIRELTCLPQEDRYAGSVRTCDCSHVGMLRVRARRAGVRRAVQAPEKNASGSPCRIGACGVLVVSVGSWAVWTLRQELAAREPGNRGGGPAVRPGCHRCRKTAGQRA